MAVKITYTEDLKYGIPQLKKYPMPDAKHVRSAIKFFNYVTPKYEKQLAKAILARMREYGMSFEDIGVGEDNRFKKYIPESGELAHHGILGQKWGVRRYQKRNGSLTEEGKRRYQEDFDQVNKKEKKVNKSYKNFMDTYDNYYKDSMRNKNGSFDPFSEEGKQLERAYKKYVNSGRDYANSLIKLQEDYGYKNIPSELIDKGYTLCKDFSKSNWGLVVGLTYIDYSFPKDELKHHGILGMKWGVRRFQNKDGTLTEAGKKRKRNSETGDADLEERRAKLKRYQDDVSNIFDDVIKDPEPYKNSFKKWFDLQNKYGYYSKDGVNKKYKDAYYKADEDEIKINERARNLIIEHLKNNGIKYAGLLDYDKTKPYWYQNYGGSEEELFDLAFQGVYADKIVSPALEEYNSLKHHGILGQKWGVRRYQNEDGSLTPAGMKRRAQQIDKSNAKYLKKYGDTINKKVEKAVEPYMKIYAERELNTSLRKLKKNGKDSRNYINAYNKRLAQLMNTAVGDLRNPNTDYVVQFIAKRGEYGVHTALAAPGTDMSRYGRGVYADGRIAYRKEGVKTV